MKFTMRDHNVPFFSSILFKLISAGSLLVLLSVGAISSLMYINFYEAILTKEKVQISHATGFFGTKLTRALNVIEADVLSWSKLPSISNLIDGRSRRSVNINGNPATVIQSDYLKRNLSKKLASGSGYQFVRLISIHETHSDVVRLVKSNADSTRVLDQHEEGDSCFIPAKLLADGDTYIDEPRVNYNSTRTGRDIIGCISTPVFDNDGKLFGVFIVGFSWSDVFRTLFVDNNNNRSFYLSSGSGSVFFYPEEHQVFFSEHNRDDFLKRELPVVYENMLLTNDKNKVFLFVDMTGNELISSIYNIYFNKGNQEFTLHVIATAPFDNIVLSTLMTDVSIGGGVLFVGVLTMFLIIVVTNSLTKPIDDILLALDTYMPNKPPPYLPVHRKDEIGILARAYKEVMRSNEVYGLELAKRTAERSAMQSDMQRLSTAVEQSVEGIMIIDVDGEIEYVNRQLVEIFGFSKNQFIGKHYTRVGWSGLNKKKFKLLTKSMERGDVWQGDIVMKGSDKSELNLHISASPIIGEDSKITGFALIARDVTERMKLEQEHKTLEQQLHQANKLESVGRLAAGIAHEINTPIQYVSDNTLFLRNAFSKLLGALRSSQTLLEASKHGPVPTEIIENMETSFKKAKIDFLSEQVDPAFSESLEGLEQVAKIVGAMKEFSHPAQEKTLVDLNRAIKSTITVSTNEWKYVANLETVLNSDLPPIPCLPGEFNQIILNIIINAAHAIAEVVGDDGAGGKGSIIIETEKVGSWIEIRISDTGAGMSESVKSRIFDAFFTTKEVGRGTGQGLSMVYNVVVDKLGGTIDVDSKLGEGSTFVIRLPIEDTSLEKSAEFV